MSVIDSREAAPIELPDAAEHQPEAGFVPQGERYRGRQLPNALSVDVEDYFQVSAFEESISRDDWDDIPSRLPNNVDRVLQIFGRENVKATFFTLGWVCERFPELIREIAAVPIAAAPRPSAPAQARIRARP